MNQEVLSLPLPSEQPNAGGQMNNAPLQQTEENPVEKIEREYREKEEAGVLVDYPIPELGIVLQLPKDIADELIYVRLRKNSVDFSTKKLQSLGGDCVAGKGPIGILGRHPESSKGRYEGIPPFIVKEYDSFFVTFDSSQAVCLAATQLTPENSKNFSEDAPATHFKTLVRSKDFWDNVRILK